MYIEDIEKTPNPSALIFVLDETLVEGFKSIEYDTCSEAPSSWVSGILSYDKVEAVMCQGSRLTVRLKDGLSWSNETELLENVADDIRSGESFSDQITDPSESDEVSSGDSDTLDDIRSLIDEEITPYLQSHGGDLDVVGLTDGKTLIIRYRGACGGCPASLTGTLKVVQRLVQDRVDEDIEVKPEGGIFDF
jgi:Fe-S cluster biogenesis protein NfuA